MTNLMQAHHQWSTRPDDERYLTIADLSAAAHARQERSRARDVSLASLRLGYSQEGDVFIDGGNKPIEFTNWSFGQLASLAGAPPAYLRQLPAPLAKINLEYGLEHGRGAEEQVKFYWTPSNGQPGLARAFTGTGYGRIFDAQVAQGVATLVENNPRWTVPLKAYNGVNSKRATTLYLSDRDVWVFLVDETRPIEIGDQTYFRGFITWNSEVGKATFGLMTFLYSRVCCNRIIWGARNVEELRIRHTALAPDRFLREAAPALDAISEASPLPIIEAISKAKATRVAPDVAGVEKWLRSKGFGLTESKVAINLAAQGGDTGSGGDPTSLWDIVQGGTALARSIAHTDDRVDTERRWSALLAPVNA